MKEKLKFYTILGLINIALFFGVGFVFGENIAKESLFYLCIFFIGLSGFSMALGGCFGKISLISLPAVFGALASLQLKANDPYYTLLYVLFSLTTVLLGHLAFDFNRYSLYVCKVKEIELIQSDLKFASKLRLSANLFLVVWGALVYFTDIHSNQKIVDGFIELALYSTLIINVLTYPSPHPKDKSFFLITDLVLLTIATTFILKHGAL